VSGGVRVIAVATDEEEQAVRERILDGSLGREIAGQFVVKRGTRTIGGGNIANAVIAIRLLMASGGRRTARVEAAADEFGTQLGHR